jgi:hypothetical protein
MLASRVPSKLSLNQPKKTDETDNSLVSPPLLVNYPLSPQSTRLASPAGRFVFIPITCPDVLFSFSSQSQLVSHLTIVTILPFFGINKFA